MPQRQGPPRWSGWVTFVGTYLFIAGNMNLLWGVAALIGDDDFSERGLLWSTLSTWGSLHLALGLLQVVTAIFVLVRNAVGMQLALGIATAGVLLSFVAVGAYPVWSLTTVAVNGLIIWALTVHVRDLVAGEARAVPQRRRREDA